MRLRIDAARLRALMKGLEDGTPIVSTGAASDWIHLAGACVAQACAAGAGTRVELGSCVALAAEAAAQGRGDAVPIPDGTTFDVTTAADGTASMCVVP